MGGSSEDHLRVSGCRERSLTFIQKRSPSAAKLASGFFQGVLKQKRLFAESRTGHPTDPWHPRNVAPLPSRDSTRCAYGISIQHRLHNRRWLLACPSYRSCETEKPGYGKKRTSKQTQTARLSCRSSGSKQCEVLKPVEVKKRGSIADHQVRHFGDPAPIPLPSNQK